MLEAAPATAGLSNTRKVSNKVRKSFKKCQFDKRKIAMGTWKVARLSEKVAKLPELVAARARRLVGRTHGWVQLVRSQRYIFFTVGKKARRSRE